jgi:sRNA-binding carbon storage regulator CsrA
MENGSLTISRKVGESFYITTPEGELIKICLSDYVGKQTKVTIEAPKNFMISREELMAG